MDRYNYPVTITDIVTEQLKDASASFPKLKVVNGMVRVYDEPDSSSKYVRIPQGTELTVLETCPSRTSQSVMALVTGRCSSIDKEQCPGRRYAVDGDLMICDGWVSLSSNHIALM